MVTWMLLTACTNRGPTPNTIDGLQIVAITSTPAQPDPIDAARLDVWVADARGAGADVLVWSCAPVDGSCLEAKPPGTDGLPFPLWTKVSTTTAADPTATVTVGWPLFAGVAADAGVPVQGVLVWALACAPGLCPVVDAVAANPAVGSEAWTATAAALAAPDQWLADLPSEQVSLAVKELAVREGTDETQAPSPANHNPTLLLDTEPTAQVSVFAASDVDGDRLDIRTFVTAGGTDHKLTDELLTVLWHAPMVTTAEQARFVVVEDGNGGTTAWSNLSTDAGCPPLEVVGFRTNDQALLPGSELPMLLENGSPYLDLELVLAGAAESATLSVSAVDAPVQTEIAALSTVADLVTEGACGRVARLTVPMLPRGELYEWMCDLGGRGIEVRASAEFSAAHSVDVILTLPEDIPCYR